MALFTPTLLVGVVLTLAAATQPGCTQPSRLLQNRIPKPDLQKYSSVQIGENWKNPYLIVRPDGIGIIETTPAGRGISVASVPHVVESVPDVLEKLPDSAWPYGLVVAVQDVGILSSSDDKTRIEANRKELLRLLRQHGIAVELWPSA